MGHTFSDNPADPLHNRLAARRVTAPPAQHLGADAWTACPMHAPFVFQQSALPVQEQTHVRALYDATHLYLGITCRLQQPVPDAGSLGYLGEHIEVFIDPAHARHASLQFAVNVSGGASCLDHRQSESSLTRRPWWAGWSAQTRRTDSGWEILLTIPLPGPLADGTVWGFNVFRCHAGSPTISSWCSYSEGFDVPAEYGHLVFGDPAQAVLPADHLPVWWPGDVPETPLELHLTVDPPDDFAGWALDPERLENYFRYFADWGVRRVYWIDYGPFDNGYWDKWGSWQQTEIDRMARSMATFDNDPLPHAVRIAHQLGMALYCEVKPWDWGNCMLFPPGSENRGKPGLARVGGVTFPTSIFTEHPELNMQRSPLGTADDWREIAEIVLMKDDDAPVRFPVTELTVWASADNTHYHQVPGVIISEAVEEMPVLRKTFTGARETSERQRVRVIHLCGLRIAERYVAVEVPGRECAFENRAFALARLFDAQGREITASIGNLSIDGNWHGSGEGWKTRGIYFEMSGATAEPGGLLVPWALDNPYGVIGLARGRNRLIPGAPEPADPQAAAWLLGWVHRAITCGADGFEYRVRNHQVAVEWEAFGYAPVVQEAFRNAYGRDLRLDGSDAAALCAFRGHCYTELLRQAKALCAAAGIPLGLQITPDLYDQQHDACTMGIQFDWRTWIREGIADQMLTKYTSPYSPIFRDIRHESAAANLPFYIEFERHFTHPDVAAIYQHYFDTAHHAGAQAVNIYEGANVARIDASGTTVSKAPEFEQFITRYSHLAGAR